MICDECGVNSASIKLMTIVNGEKHEKHLCTTCMAKVKKQFNAVDLSSLAGLLGGLLQVAKQSKDQEDEPAEMIEDCPVCGQTYEEFKKTGFLGCAACYQAFRDPVEVILKRVHGNTQHAGRAPGGSGGGLSIKLNIDRLKQQLGRAIAEEEYEQAARLRDQIRALKGQLAAVSADSEVESHD